MTLFTIESQEFGWDEIVIAAELWGEWQNFVETVRQSLACLHVATETNQLPSPASIREVANAFRYERNLISGEETRNWLDRWGMTVESWLNCLRGQFLRKHWASRLGEITESYPVAEVDVTEVISNYAVCEGKLDAWSRKLAGRAAVAASPGSLPARKSSSREVIAHIESEFESTRQQTVTPKLIEAKIEDHRLDWIHYQCRCLWLDEERVAREAAWCVSEDGLTLDEVAVAAHTEVLPWNFYADEIETSVRPYFLAARQGDLLGPWKLREKYPLFSLIKKCMPHAGDPKIRSRAEEAIVTSLLARAVNERVKWVC